MRINLFYISIILVAIGLWCLVSNLQTESISFYGFAETNETEINFNHPVVIDNILVSSGQKVVKGETLMKVSRVKSKEFLQKQTFEIEELKAENKIWQANKDQKIKVMDSEQALKLNGLDAKIKELEKELKFKKNLVEGLSTITTKENSYKPLEDKIKIAKTEKEFLKKSFQTEKNALLEEKKLGKSPYQEKIKSLMAEIQFDNETQIISNNITAPSDGLIGNIHCKAAEHIPSYKTLISFYEPHPTQVIGFVHEDLIMSVNIGDMFTVSSLKNQAHKYDAKVIGLGSRIIEIPERLRKIPDVKAYGREVTLEINPQNALLQKEKVALELVSASKTKVPLKDVLVNKK